MPPEPPARFGASVIAASDRLQALYVLSEDPVLTAHARQHTYGSGLDGKTIASIYKTHLDKIDERTLVDHERQFMLELGVDSEIITSAALQGRYPYMFPLVVAEKQRAYRLFRGWLPSLVDTCRRIDALLGADKRGFHWTRMSEKYGAPSFIYILQGRSRVAINDDLPSSVTGALFELKENQDAVALQINKVIREVEAKLRSTCIVCGAPSEINNDQGPWASLCAEHRADTFKEGHKDWKGAKAAISSFLSERCISSFSVEAAPLCSSHVFDEQWAPPIVVRSVLVLLYQYAASSGWRIAPWLDSANGRRRGRPRDVLANHPLRVEETAGRCVVWMKNG
ncbi:MAG: hypothetical protein BGP22_21975 [Variovorax sp. 67-131]|nr:MAG: hypothetical protein BGP22_21975 [Variovorax sp. 67-131]